MGNLQATEFANSGLDRRTALHWHLTSNHYPPLPAEYVDTCVEAIDKAAEAVVAEDYEALEEKLQLPDVPVVPRRAENGYATVDVLVEAFHLDAFVEAAVAEALGEDEEE